MGWDVNVPWHLQTKNGTQTLARIHVEPGVGLGGVGTNIGQVDVYVRINRQVDVYVHKYQNVQASQMRNVQARKFRHVQASARPSILNS